MVVGDLDWSRLGQWLVIVLQNSLDILFLQRVMTGSKLTKRCHRNAGLLAVESTNTCANRSAMAAL